MNTSSSWPRLGSSNALNLRSLSAAFFGLLVLGILLALFFSAPRMHDPRDLVYWSNVGANQDWSTPAARGDAQAQFFCGIAIVRPHLTIMIEDTRYLSDIPLIGKRFFRKVSYGLDNGITQAQLAVAYSWLKQSAEQGFAPAQHAEKLFIGKINMGNTPGRQTQPTLSAHTNLTTGSAR